MGYSFLICLADVSITGKTFKEHLNNLGEVLSRFRKFGLNIMPTKCSLFREQVLFLGHVVGKYGVRANPSLVQDVEKWPVSQNLKELQAFLGLTNYYRRLLCRYCPIFAQFNSEGSDILLGSRTGSGFWCS